MLGHTVEYLELLTLAFVLMACSLPGNFVVPMLCIRDGIRLSHRENTPYFFPGPK